MKYTEQEKKTCFPLKIFAIFFHPSEHVTAMGGAEKRFVETLKILCKKSDVRITVLEPSPSLLDKSEITCKKYTISSRQRGKGWLSTYLEWGIWTAKAFVKSSVIVCREKSQVILIPNNTLPNLTLGYIIGLVLRRPVCVIVHHVDSPLTKKGSETDSLYGAYRSLSYNKIVSFAKTLTFYVTFPILRRVKSIIAVSNFTAKTLQHNGVSNVFVSGNAIDLDFINRIRPCNTERVFDGIFVGRIAKEKGIFDLLETWKNVVIRRKEARLLIIGSGLELVSVKQKIAEFGLEGNITIRGRCNDSELYGLLKSSKTFIFLSFFEGWGIAVAEALACGLPVVAYDIPALREVFGPCKSVFLAPVGKTDKVTKIVSELSNADNKKLRETSVDYVKNFSWDKVAMADLEAIMSIAT